MTAKSFSARHPAFSFVFLPVVILIILTIASGVAEVVLDHAVLRRASNGMPLLYMLPWVRALVTGWNLVVVYVAPIVMALGIWRLGSARGVGERWLWSGGLLISVLGGLHYLETRWTGIKGTSTLLMGPVPDARMALFRVAANVLIFTLGVWLLKKRASPTS